MTRRARIHEEDLARIVRAIRGTGLEIHSVTVDPEGGVTVAVQPQHAEANRAEIRADLAALRARGIERRAERAAREGRTGKPGRKGTTP